jgi:hypothetical protein
MQIKLNTLATKLLSTSIHPLAINLTLSDEIVQLREYRAANPNAGSPAFNDTGYRALVEENVKNSVWSISQDPIMTDVSGPSFSLDHFQSAWSKRFIGPSFLLADDPDNTANAFLPAFLSSPALASLFGRTK